MRKGPRRQRNNGKMPRNAAPVECEIGHVGSRGDGVGKAEYRHDFVTMERAVFVPGTLPGEQVIAQPVQINSQGIRAELSELVSASPERRDPDCDAFPACGGCALQHWQDEAVDRWKTEQLEVFLSRAGVAPLARRAAHIAPRHSRRRASFHLKRLQHGVVAGFQERGSSRITPPTGCSVLHPALLTLLEALSDLAAQIFPVGVPVDAQANLLDRGICLLLRGPDGWHDGILESLTGWAVDHATAVGLVRLSAAEGDGEPLTLLAPNPPTLTFGEIAITPPPGAFLQATRESEAALQTAVADAVGDAARVIDLFAGCGTLSLPLLPGLSHLTAAESDNAALAALKAGVDASGRGSQLTCLRADLMNAPLTPDQLHGHDAAIIDPPRAGGEAQCTSLVESGIPVIAMVSCNPASFARDAALLCDGGYQLDWLQLVDQFRFTAHVELVARFSRTP